MLFVIVDFKLVVCKIIFGLEIEEVYGRNLVSYLDSFVVDENNFGILFDSTPKIEEPAGEEIAIVETTVLKFDCNTIPDLFVSKMVVDSMLKVEDICEVIDVWSGMVEIDVVIDATFFVFKGNKLVDPFEKYL